MLFTAAGGRVLISPQAHKASAFWKGEGYRLVRASQIVNIDGRGCCVNRRLVPTDFDADAVIRVQRAVHGKNGPLGVDVDRAAVRDIFDVIFEAVRVVCIQVFPVQSKFRLG